ncbi:hypothetical protein J2S17_005316 [Cytobacillus purgationiresistens]|uniref:Uncharacterized protein n=1 Tax=Cytobacillus purgationiresistens TaxID=863449 RepID=A0ABU0AQ21_9BACI|nr:hypothetical protein [Cytobacillus purgationiresistens]
MTNKSKLTYIVLFVLLPVLYLVSSFIVRYLIQGRDFSLFFSDSFGILGIYYVFVSIIFMIAANIKNVSLKDI